MSTGPYSSLSPQLVTCLYNALQPRPWAKVHLRSADLGDATRGIDRHNADDATARRIAEFEPLLDVLAGRAPADSDLARNIARTVIGLDQIKDDDLAGLALLPNLARLMIHCKVGSGGIAHLARVPGLRTLALPKLATDAIPALALLTQVEELDLRGVSGLDDHHVPLLRSLASVHTLFVPSKTLSSDALIALAARDPERPRPLRTLHTYAADDRIFAGILSQQSDITGFFDIYSKVTDAGIAAADLSRVEVLSLSRAGKLTDAALSSILSRAPKLTHLKLDGSKITDKALLDPANAAALQRLAASGKLRELDLGSTKISDASAPTLASLTGLVLLRVTSTKVTGQGVGQIKQTLRGCNVVHLG